MMVPMKVVLHQDVFLCDADNNDLWKTAAHGQREIEMPCAPQVGWDMHIGSEIAPTRVENVKYVLRAGHLHVYLEPVKVRDVTDVTPAIEQLKRQGYEVRVV